MRGREELRHRLMQCAAELAQAAVDGAHSDRYFLTRYMFSQASSVFEANEMLALLDALKPVFDAQPPHVQAGKQWRQYRIDWLSQAGQAEQVLELKKQLAVDFPQEAGIQEQYVQALVQARDYVAARAWLDSVLAGDREWEAAEVESLRGIITQMYRDQSRYEDLTSYLAAWVATNPEGAAAYQQYLWA